jgi:hypothetical protein
MSETVPYVLAALLDVMGYRDQLQRDRESGRLDFKDSLQKAMQVLSNVNEAEYAYQAISDTIIVTCADVDDLVGLLTVLKDVQLAFLREGLLVRGGVAYERHFKSNNITYSHAVALAYQIERDVAVYPRIVIDQNVIGMQRPDGPWPRWGKAELVCLHNGVFFLNVLDRGNWSEVYRWAKTIYENSRQALLGREKEFAKHVWFEDYLFTSPFKAEDGSPRYIDVPLLLSE